MRESESKLPSRATPSSHPRTRTRKRSRRLRSVRVPSPPSCHSTSTLASSAPGAERVGGGSVYNSAGRRLAPNTPPHTHTQLERQPAQGTEGAWRANAALTKDNDRPGASRGCLGSARSKRCGQDVDHVTHGSGLARAALKRGPRQLRRLLLNHPLNRLGQPRHGHQADQQLHGGGSGHLGRALESAQAFQPICGPLQKPTLPCEGVAQGIRALELRRPAIDAQLQPVGRCPPRQHALKQRRLAAAARPGDHLQGNGEQGSADSRRAPVTQHVQVRQGA